MSDTTVASLIERVSAQFQSAGLTYGHGTDNPWDEAVALVLHVTGARDDAQDLGMKVRVPQVEQVLSLAGKRIADRIPLPYLLGRCTYMGLDFRVRPGVIVPRSPIGYLLSQPLPWMPQEVNRVLDLCCGSGCLGIVAATIFPQARVTLVDNNEDALTLAEENVSLHQLHTRLDLVHADVTSGWPFNTELNQQPYDLILANPPYVDAADMHSLPAEYRAEPATALAAGADGLDVLSAILNDLGHLMHSNSLFIGEVGASAPALLRRFPSLPFIWPDLEQGGEGVFLLEGERLSSHTAGNN